MSPVARRESLLAVLFLAIAALFFFDAAIGRGAFFHYDTWMQNFAFRAWWFAELKAGRFATWCPGMFAGYPLFAETQTGPLFPTTFVLFLLLPPTLAFSWSVILMFALGGWGACTLVRRLGGSVAAGVLAGVAYELSGFLVTHVVHFNLLTGAALLPWALVCVAGLSARANVRDFLGLAFVVAGFALGSHPYAMGMAFVATIVIVGACARGVRDAVRAGGAALGAWGMGLAIGAVQLLPAAELLRRTPRGHAVDSTFLTFGSYPPKQIAALVNPDVFGTPVDGSFFGGIDWSHFAETCAYAGILPLALAVVALVLRRDRATVALVILAVAAFVLMLGDRSSVWRALAAIPIVQSTRLPARWALPFTLAVVSLAGLGLDAILREQSARRRWGAVAAGAGVVIGIAAFAWWVGRESLAPPDALRGGGMLWPAKLAVITESARAAWGRVAILLAASLAMLAALASFASSKRGVLLAALAAAVVLADLASWGAAFNPRVPPATLTARPPAVDALPDASPRPRIVRQGVDEMWERVPGMPRVDLFTPAWKGRASSYASGAWALPPNSQLLYGVDSVEGFTSLPPLAWLEWMGTPASMGAVPRVDLTEAQADLLSVDAVLSTGSGIAGEGWSATPLPGDVWVSRNLDPLPRARIATAWRALARDEILASVRRSDYDPRRSVLLERVPAGLATGADSGSVSPLAAKEIAPGDWSIEVPAGEGAVVVLAECDDPGWRARDAEGRLLEIVRADGLFVGFAAPEAGGTIRVRHEPPQVRQGAFISGFSLATAVGAALLLARRGRTGRAAIRDASRPPFTEHAVPRGVVPAVLASGFVVVVIGLVSGGTLGRHSAPDAAGGATIRSAAVRTWCAEAEGAYRARAWDAAVGLLERAARVAPDDASIHHRRGLVERERGRPDEARRASESREHP